MLESVPELPGGWHWGVGEITGESETYWFYTDETPAYQGELFTDAGQPWTAVFYEELGYRESGDVEVDEYPTTSMTFETEAEAIEWIQETANNLLDN